jgi:hypothetical protein
VAESWNVTKSRGINAPKFKWTPERVELLRRKYPDTLAQVIASELGAGLNAIYKKATTLGLKKSADFNASERSGRLRPGDDRGKEHRFQKGWPSPRLGKPFPTRGRMGTTQFKKGSKPHNARYQLGDRRISSEGYVDRKIREDRRGGQNWEAEHRLVWKEAHGQIPPGHLVTFKPGRFTTELAKITVDALELVTREEHLRRHTLHNLPKDLVQVIQLKGAVTRQINKRARNEEQN